MRNKVFTRTEELLKQVEDSQMEAIEVVAKAMVETLDKGGIIQAFGSGHSIAGAKEICHRAGGFIPTKEIKEPAYGAYESIEGVGKSFMKKVDIRENDLVFFISNSGRNPLSVEMAVAAKEKGAKTVAVTSLEASKHLKPKSSIGKNLYEVCDFILDNCVPEGDAAVEIDGLDQKVCGMSSITTGVLLEAVVYRAIEIMIEEGKEPLIYKSQNIDGGREFNEAIEKRYVDRLYRI